MDDIFIKLSLTILIIISSFRQQLFTILLSNILPYIITITTWDNSSNNMDHIELFVKNFSSLSSEIGPPFLWFPISIVNGKFPNPNHAFTITVKDVAEMVWSFARYETGLFSCCCWIDRKPIGIEIRRFWFLCLMV